MLDLKWFYSYPIDYEHKHYLLLAYTTKMDISFSVKVLSPYLLWTERLVEEMRVFAAEFTKLDSSLRKEVEGFSIKRGVIYKPIKMEEEMQEIIDITKYSIPILEAKIELGYKLWKKYPQILF